MKSLPPECAPRWRHARAVPLWRGQPVTPESGEGPAGDGHSNSQISRRYASLSQSPRCREGGPAVVTGLADLTLAVIRIPLFPWSTGCSTAPPRAAEFRYIPLRRKQANADTATKRAPTMPTRTSAWPRKLPVSIVARMPGLPVTIWIRTSWNTPVRTSARHQRFTPRSYHVAPYRGRHDRNPPAGLRRARLPRSWPSPARLTGITAAGES
jgi:hypothetical protein